MILREGNLEFNFMGAIDAFEILIQNDSENDYADNAQYWIGESYYALDEYSKAIESFRKVINFADSNKADAANSRLDILTSTAEIKLVVMMN